VQHHDGQEQPLRQLSKAPKPIMIGVFSSRLDKDAPNFSN